MPNILEFFMDYCLMPGNQYVAKWPKSGLNEWPMDLPWKHLVLDTIEDMDRFVGKTGHELKVILNNPIDKQEEMVYHIHR